MRVARARDGAGTSGAIADVGTPLPDASATRAITSDAPLGVGRRRRSRIGHDCKAPLAREGTDSTLENRGRGRTESDERAARAAGSLRARALACQSPALQLAMTGMMDGLDRVATGRARDARGRPSERASGSVEMARGARRGRKREEGEPGGRTGLQAEARSLAPCPLATDTCGSRHPRRAGYPAPAGAWRPGALTRSDAIARFIGHTALKRVGRTTRRTVGRFRSHVVPTLPPTVPLPRPGAPARPRPLIPWPGLCARARPRALALCPGPALDRRPAPGHREHPLRFSPPPPPLDLARRRET